MAVKPSSDLLKLEETAHWSCVLTSIPTLRPYLVYTLCVRSVWRDYLRKGRLGETPIISLVPLVVNVQRYQEKE